MADSTISTVAVHLPASLIAKLTELKEEREEDRGKPVEQLVRELVEEYIHVREMTRWEIAHSEELNRAYAEHPGDGDEERVWAEVYPPEQDEENS